MNIKKEWTLLGSGPFQSAAHEFVIVAWSKALHQLARQRAAHNLAPRADASLHAIERSQHLGSADEMRIVGKTRCHVAARHEPIREALA